MRRRRFLELAVALPLLAGCSAQLPGQTAAVTSAARWRAYGHRRISFAEALERVDKLQAKDDGGVLRGAHTHCLQHGRPTEMAVVLFHGFTNNPMQYERFARLLYARGCNVLVPRLPGHGDADRMSTRLASVTVTDFLTTAIDAVDIASGLGARIVVSGISLGATLCAWLPTARPDIHRSVPIAPTLGIGHVPYFISTAMVNALSMAQPDKYSWWDPKLKEHITPKHAYPRYPVRVLSECFQIGESVVEAHGPFPGSNRTNVTFVINPLDPAINNRAVFDLSDHWRKTGWMRSTVVAIQGLPAIHDIIEPENPQQRVAVVYPRLFEAMLGR